MANNRKTQFGLVYELLDNTALNDATFNASNAWAFAEDFSELKLQRNIPNEMTWEHNFCILDGSQDEWSDAPENNHYGFFSLYALHPQTGQAQGDLYVEATFTEHHSSYALTIGFIDHHPLHIQCIWYDGSMVLHSSIYEVTNKDFVIKQAVQNYNKIRINFLDGIPDRYIKLNYIMFGMIINWTEKELKSGNVTYEIDPVSELLPDNLLTFEFIDPEETANPGNRNGLHEFFQPNQIMKPYEMVNNQKIELPKFFLKDFSYTRNVCRINATSILGMLDKIPFTSPEVAGRAGTSNYITVGTWITKIFNCAKITNYCTYTINSSISDKYLYYGIQPGLTCREALRQVLFAANATIDLSDRDYDGQAGHYDIKIVPRTSIISGGIERKNKFSTSIRKIDYVSGIKVIYSVVEWSSTTSANELIIEGDYEAGTYYVEWDVPRSGLVPTVVGSGMQLNVLSAYKLSFMVAPASGTAHVKIISSSIGEWKEHTVTVEREENANKYVNIKEYRTTLCNEETATQLAEALLEYFNSTLEIDIKSRVTGDHIGINEMYVIENPTTGLNDYVGRYKQRNIDLAGGFIDNAKFISYYNNMDVNYYVRSGVDEIELYTDDNEVI